MFKMPESYYTPPETLMWFQSCNDCDWVSECEIEFNDLSLVETCPCCGSDSIATGQDYL